MIEYIVFVRNLCIKYTRDKREWEGGEERGKRKGAECLMLVDKYSTLNM